MRFSSSLLTALGLLPLTAFSRAATVFDQIGNGSQLSTNSVGSQDFEPRFEALDIMGIEDLTITSETTLTNVSVGLRFFNGPSGSIAGVTNYHFAIFSAGAAIPSLTLTGDVADSNLSVATARVTQNYGVAGNWLVSLDLSAEDITLAPGSYYFGIEPAYDFDSGGQVGITTGSLLNGPTTNAWQFNPNGGLGLANGVAVLPNTNLAYRLEGTQAVPEPATMAALGLGVAASLRRRRRV